jgi:hypothetical protein
VTPAEVMTGPTLREGGDHLAPTPKGGVASIGAGLFTYLVARKPPAQPTKAEQWTTFLAAVEQLEALAVEIDLAWPEDGKR